MLTVCLCLNNTDVHPVVFFSPCEDPGSIYSDCFPTMLPDVDVEYQVVMQRMIRKAVASRLM